MPDQGYRGSKARRFIPANPASLAYQASGHRACLEIGDKQKTPVYYCTIIASNGKVDDASSSCKTVLVIVQQIQAITGSGCHFT
jgi:hypothetical protein